MIALKNLNKPYNIFSEDLEQSALEQLQSAMEQPFSIRGALMPDAHQGYSLPIGAVVETDGVLLPSWVGYDIGCGMCAVKTTFDFEQIYALRFEIQKQISSRRSRRTDCSA